jgi:hypothetical protein
MLGALHVVCLNVVLLNVVLLNVVRSSRAAITSAARRQVHEGCADDCADCGPGDPHHDRTSTTRGQQHKRAALTKKDHTNVTYQGVAPQFQCKKVARLPSRFRLIIEPKQ